DLRAEKKVQQKALGTTLITFTAGLVTGAVPYPNLYNGSGAHDPDYYIYSGEGFQTMGLTEFLSDRYTALFLHHDFGGLLYRSNGFSPTLAAVTNIGFGSLQHPERHRNLAFSTMEKGYYESGLMVNDLLGTGFFGLGIGGFYRYGAYSKPVFKDNLALKGVLNFKF
ncbi:MAG TPA: hypothetical protein VK927_03560, partial [Adhaeribacter sp.]|nr:hypothetical protein [Adhaeribacter sp.]